MPRELLMMQNNFEWGTAEGQTLEIENAIRSNIRDLKIEGQTYQNLVDENNVKLGNYSYNAGTGEYRLTNPATKVWNAMYISYTRPIQEGEKLLIRVNIVKNTIATTEDSPLKITFSNFSNSTKGFINVDSNFTGLLEYYCDSATVKENDNKNIGISTKNYTSGELVIKDIQVIPVSENLLLNNIKLPTSINGIESVAERESKQNLYTEGDLNIKGKNSWLIVQKTVAVKPNTKYKISLDIESISKGSNNYSPGVEFYFNAKVTNNFSGKLLGSGSLTLTTKEDTTTLIFAFVVNGASESTIECEANFKNIKIYESDEYPVKIAQSNNETDGIILPNGVKNTIENGKHIKRIGKYIITGNETFELRHENNSTFKIQCRGLSIEQPTGDYASSNVEMICDKALCEFCGDPSYVNDSLVVCDRSYRFKGFIISIPKKLLTEYTIDKAKEYIKSLGGMTVWYQLAIPITESVTLTEIPLPQPLRSLPNGVCDEVVGNKLIQRVGKYTITGTETYDLRFKNDYMFVVQFDNILTETAFGDYNNSNTKMICDKALCRDCSNSTFVSNSLTIGGRLTNSKGFIIAIPKSLLTEYTIDKAKEYIKSLGGMTVYYELATPIEHTINVPRVSIAKGSNIITTTNNIKPNLSIKYKKIKNKR